MSNVSNQYSLTSKFVFSFFLYILVYIIWYDLILNSSTIKNDVGSLIFLPHGMRYLLIVGFGWIGFWAVILGAIFAPAFNEEVIRLNHHPLTEYLNFWHNLESLIGGLSLLVTVRFLYWAKLIDSLQGKLFYGHPSKLMLIVITSAFLNGLLSNFVTAMAEHATPTSPIRVIRFVVGDIFGALILLTCVFVGWRLWKRFILN
jgi:hypothetical protein